MCIVKQIHEQVDCGQSNAKHADPMYHSGADWYFIGTLLQFQMITYSKGQPLPCSVRTRRLLTGISVSPGAVLKLSKGLKKKILEDRTK